MAATGIAAGVYPAAEAQAVVKAAFVGGVNWFDTAEGYGGSEQALTTALRSVGAQPGEVVIATKWLPMGRRASNIPRTISDRIAETANHVFKPTTISAAKSARGTTERDDRAGIFHPL